MPRRPRGPTTQQAHIPAPIGGLNTVDGGTTMPPQDAILAYNVLASEHGLRTRLGYSEWVTNLSGQANLEVRTMLSFTGSAKNGAADRLFCVTSAGIWDVTSSTAAPIVNTLFAQTGPDAGYGTSAVVSTVAGRFLVYCDEENGAYVYTESTGLWAKVALATNAPWVGSTAYDVGDYVINNGNEYVCTNAGTSAVSGGPTTTASGITDGGATWDYVAAAQSNTIGPSSADQDLGYTGDPANFVQVCVWKNRLWFVERDTSLAWYMGVNALYGEATSFNFGGKMKAGGPLRGLFNWTYDGGNGLDTSLVGISGGGDVVIYQGTDPSSISTFGLKGCWSVGAVPAGRRIATDYGGDLLVLSLVGVVPLSKLVVGADEANQGIYATAKIANLFNSLASTRATLPGWAVYIHPTDNAIIVTVPTSGGAATEQLAMAISAKSWSRYRDLPILSATTFEGDFWFGTADGRVCKNVGSVDDVKLADSSDNDEISWSVFTAYRNTGSMNQKQVKLVRPILIGGDVSPVYQVTAKYDFDLLEPSAPTSGPTGGWDSGAWDSALWGGEYTPSTLVVGVVGMGRNVALAIRGKAASRTVLIGFDVVYEEGGPL